MLGLPRPSAWLAVATAPPALAGLLLERPIERRLGTPRAIAAGLVLGGLAMTLADKRGQTLHSSRGQTLHSSRGLTLQDAAWLGIAQATALVPGVSRHGAALTALRARGVSRPDAHRLSREASRPVLLGATVLKGLRLRGDLRPHAAAAAGSALSTLAARRALAGRGERAPLWPFALYRAALAASVWRHG